MPFGFSFFKNKEIQSLREEMSLYQRQLEDIGWVNISVDNFQNQEVFGRGFKKMLQECKLFYYKNPLAGLWINMTTDFVFGEGITKPRAKEDSIQEIVDELWEDPDNKKAMFSFLAQQLLSNKLQYEGNIFMVIFEDMMGKIKVRFLNTDEVDDIVLDPEDRNRENFYKVRTQKNKYNFVSGAYEWGARDFEFYPGYENFDVNAFGVPIDKLRDDVRVMHFKINCDVNDKFGVPQLYRGLDWIKAHKNQAEDVATLVKALSQFAWKKKVKGTAAQVSSISNALRGKASLTNIQNSVGQTQVENEGIDLQSVDVKTGGVNIGIDSMRQSKLMVCAASGLFEHYFGDPSTGNLATAKSMELPMIKKFVSMQMIWQSIYLSLINYAIDRKVEAGLLSGKVEVDEINRRKKVTTTVDRTVEVDFPPILESDVKMEAEGMIIARGKLIPKETAARYFMTSANIENIDEEIKKLQEEMDEDAQAAEDNIEIDPVTGKPKVIPKQNGQDEGNNDDGSGEKVKETIETPKKKILARHSKKESFMLQKMNGYRNMIAGHFKRFLESVRKDVKVSSYNKNFVGHVPNFNEHLNKFTEGMRDSAKIYFPLAVQVGAKYMQSVLKDVQPSINISETLYEANGRADKILSERLQWNDNFIATSLQPAMLTAFEKVIRDPYLSEAAFIKAVTESLKSFESRIEHYVGAFWTTEEQAVKEAGIGTGVLVNFVGPDDTQTCEGCNHAVNGSPWPIEEAPLPGEQECLGRCRHALQVVTKEE